MVIWLIGMSGAGKTTIGRRVWEQWRAKAPNTVFVDGDEVRALFRHDQRPDAHKLSGRRVNAERITDLCAWLDGQGINVVCCILSLFPDMRAGNRERYSRYFETYVKVPLDKLKQRDVKDIYAPALRGERTDVVGVDIAFPEPEAPDLIIDNGIDGLDPDETARHILTAAGLA